MRVSGYKSHRGLHRENNEDSFFVDDKVGVYVIADGMGGHEGGEVASDIAVNTLGKIFSNFFGSGQEKKIPQIIHKALQEANDAITEMRKKNIELFNMGTTVVLSIFFNELVYYSHLGDSRAYLYNNKGMLYRMPDITLEGSCNSLTPFSEKHSVNALELVNTHVQMPSTSVEIENFAVSDEVGAQISPSERLQRLAEQIVRTEMRKLAISLMFPLLDKFKMPITLA